MPHLLLIMLGLPLATAIVVAFLGPQRISAVRWLTLAGSLVTLGLSIAAAGTFAAPRIQNAASLKADPAIEFKPEMDTHFDLLTLQASTSHDSAIQFYVGVDGLNVWLVVLTTLLIVAAVLGSWTAITDRPNQFYAWMLALETGMIGVFLAFDIVLFYVFFELTLVPLFFLIGIWGGPQRQYAAKKFFIYTLTGSLLTLLGVLGIVLTVYQEKSELTFSIPSLVKHVDDLNKEISAEVNAKQAELAEARAPGAGKPAPVELEVGSKEQLLRQAKDHLNYWRNVQFWVFAAMMCGFAIKVPLVPVHTWLPLAHVEAPTAGSVLLAGVLLKIGTYGFLRLCVPLAPDASLRFGAPLIATLAVIGIIYGAFCALAQDDIKKLVAYSSVSHLGFCMLGLFALNEVGLSGSLLQMINHGLSTGGLFLLVGMLYERYHTRRMQDYGGMSARLRLLGLFMVFIAMASIGLPGLNGFIGELLVLAGMYDFQGSELSGRFLTCLATSGVLLGAWYTLTMLRRVFFGEVKEPQHEGHGHVADLNGRELTAIVPIALLCLFLGLFPNYFLDTARPDLRVVARIAAGARQRATDEARQASIPAASPESVALVGGETSK